MEISTRRVSKNILELTVNSYGTNITVDVTDLNGRVDENLIQNLREIAFELEEQNERINA